MTDYLFILPEDFDGFALEVKDKGWFSAARLIVSEVQYELNFFDPLRLAQEIERAIQADGRFFEPNLVVIQAITRANMEKAVEFLVRSGHMNFLVSE